MYICTIKIKINNNNSTMEAQDNTKKYWALCFTWLAVMITLMFVYREFFWLALPGTVTYFAKAMKLF
jgi:hypothetical protein